MADVVAVGKLHLRAGVNGQNVGREFLIALVHGRLEHCWRCTRRPLERHDGIGQRLALFVEHLRRESRGRSIGSGHHPQARQQC